MGHNPRLMHKALVIGLCLATVAVAWYVDIGLGLLAFFLAVPAAGNVLDADEDEQRFHRFRRMTPAQRAEEHRRRMGYR